jgi:flavin-dependent dehydrogenase
MGPEQMEADVVIIGGGPAGLAAAIAARRKGFRVLVIDHGQSPVDKACGEGLMPDGVAALKSLGVEIPADGVSPFHGIRFIEGDVAAEAFFPNGCGLGIRRTVLHGTLTRAAKMSGVDILWGAKVSGIAPGQVHMGGSRIRCRWIIGADGQNSGTRRWSDLDRPCHARLRYGYRQHFPVPPWTNLVEVYWDSCFQVVITPVNPGLVCVAVVSGNPRLRPGDAINILPALSRRLGGTRPLDAGKGAVSAHRVMRSVAHPRSRSALIGDASGSVDCITGEGLCLSFKQAIFLAEALAAGDLSSYIRAHRRIMRVPILMSRLLLAMGDCGVLRRRVIRVFAKRPWIFSRLLETHIGEVTPAALDIQGLLGLGLQLLRG